MENTGQAAEKTIWDDIIKVIDSQSSTYEDFLKFMKTKQKAIIKGDIQDLKTLEGQEKVFVGRLEQLEDLRRETASECLGGRDATLRDLLAGAPESHRQDLERAALRLMESINSVVVTHKGNTELLEEAIHFVQFNLNLLTSSGGAGSDSIYGRSGRLNDADVKIKGLLNKQV